MESITNRADHDLRRLSEVMDNSGSALKVLDLDSTRQSPEAYLKIRYCNCRINFTLTSQRAKTESQKAFPHMISTSSGVDRGKPHTHTHPEI